MNVEEKDPLPTQAQVTRCFDLLRDRVWRDPGSVDQHLYNVGRAKRGRPFVEGLYALDSGIIRDQNDLSDCADVFQRLLDAANWQRHDLQTQQWAVENLLTICRSRAANCPDVVGPGFTLEAGPYTKSTFPPRSKP